MPTPAFFYGLQIGEEIEIEIDPGKILIIKLISIGEAGLRTASAPCSTNSTACRASPSSPTNPSPAPRPPPARKATPDNPAHVCAPMPGMVTEIAVSPGQEVKAGDKLVILEAMKMLTTVSAPADGTITDILVKKGDQVDSDDLLVVME